MKRLIICCDGTWQDLKSSYLTNVVKITQYITPVDQNGVRQIVFYDPGIGTEGGLRKIFGGAFGWGIQNNIKEAYRFLCLNYEKDDEIYLFGFSRGAYTIRSLAGLIYNSGLVTRDHFTEIPYAYDLYKDKTIGPHDTVSVKFRKKHSLEAPITLLGCWDTVGSLGVPNQIPYLPLDRWINRKYRFHDTKLNRRVLHACHAVAIDERRKSFNFTKMEKSDNAPDQKLMQIWFPGDHGCVGGGSADKRYISDITLKWMIDQISSLNLGLTFDQKKLNSVLEINHAVHCNIKPRGIFKIARRIWRKISDDPATLDISVYKRWRDVDAYRPKNLVRQFKDTLDGWASKNPA